MDLFNSIYSWLGNKILDLINLIFCGATSILFKLIFQLVLVIIQIFFRQGIYQTSFANFDKMISMFGKITNLNELGTVIYVISAFIIAFGIVVSGIKMSAGFLEKTGDSPTAFLKRAIYTICLLAGYKTIVSLVIDIMNAIASTGPFNMLKNLNFFGNVADFIDGMADISVATTNLVNLLISIVLYIMLISKIIPALITYYERYLSFAVYLLMGPIVISLGIDPENKDIGKNWLMGILSQMITILFSMFVFNLFLLQLKGFLFGDTLLNTDSDLTTFFTGDGTAVGGVSTTSVSNLIVCCALLTIVEKSEQFINMLGLRTIPSGDTARTFAGTLGSTFHSALHFVPSAIEKGMDISAGTGRKNDYAGLRRQATAYGVANANVLSKEKMASEVAIQRLSGIAEKKGVITNKDKKAAIDSLVKEGGISKKEATQAVNESAGKVQKAAAARNKEFSEAIANGGNISAKTLEKKTSMNPEKIQLKDGEARAVFNKETGSNVLAKTEDGQEIYGYAVVDDKGNSQINFYKGKKDENGLFVGKSLNDSDLEQLNGVEAMVKARGNERDISNPQVLAKFKDDAKFQEMTAKGIQLEKEFMSGKAVEQELNEHSEEMRKYMEDHGVDTSDDNGFVSIGKLDSNKMQVSDSNFSSGYAQLTTQVKEIDPETNAGANIATSQLKYNEDTGNIDVKTDTFIGNVNRDIETKDGSPVIREANKLKEVTSGAQFGESDALTSREFASHADVINKAHAERESFDLEYTDKNGTKQVGTAYKTPEMTAKEEKAAEMKEYHEQQKQYKVEQETAVQEVRKKYEDERYERQKAYDAERNAHFDFEVEEVKNMPRKDREAYKMVTDRKRAENDSRRIDRDIQRDDRDRAKEEQKKAEQAEKKQAKEREQKARELNDSNKI